MQEPHYAENSVRNPCLPTKFPSCKQGLNIVDEAVLEEPDPDDLAAIDNEAVRRGRTQRTSPQIDDEAASEEPDPDDSASESEATTEATPQAIHDGASSSAGLAVRNWYFRDERLLDESVRIIDATPVEALQDPGCRHMMDDERSTHCTPLAPNASP